MLRMVGACPRAPARGFPWRGRGLSRGRAHPSGPDPESRLLGTELVLELHGPLQLVAQGLAARRRPVPPSNYAAARRRADWRCSHQFTTYGLPSTHRNRVSGPCRSWSTPSPPLSTLLALVPRGLRPCENLGLVSASGHEAKTATAGLTLLGVPPKNSGMSSTARATATRSDYRSHNPAWHRLCSPCS